MIQEYFTVQLSDSIYLGLPLADMTTVAQFERRDICIVPGVAPFWHGVVNFKGSLLWVLDTKRLFNLDTKSDRIEAHSLIQKPVAVVLSHQIQGTQRRVALVVQKLQGIFSVESSKLKSLPLSASSPLRNLCTAMAEQDNITIYILNSEVFLQQLHQRSTLTVAA